MTFFSPDKLRPRKIHVDTSQSSCDSPDVQKRLSRIEDNYERLDMILAELEGKLDSDTRLKAIDDQNVDFEAEYGIKKKRKWRSPSKRLRAKDSANPKKPR